MKCYMIQRKTDGLFWCGRNGCIKFSEKGKVWRTLGSPRCAISHKSHTRIFKDCVIVEFEMTPVNELPTHR